MLAQGRQRRDEGQDQIGEAKPIGGEGPAGLRQLVLKALPRSRADTAEAPAVVELERVAVADHNRIACFECACLGPAGTVHLGPVGGLCCQVVAVWLKAGGGVLLDDGYAASAAPGCLAGRARPLHDDNHPVIFDHATVSPADRLESLPVSQAGLRPRRHGLDDVRTSTSQPQLRHTDHCRRKLHRPWIVIWCRLRGRMPGWGYGS